MCNSYPTEESVMALQSCRPGFQITSNLPPTGTWNRLALHDPTSSQSKWKWRCLKNSCSHISQGTSEGQMQCCKPLAHGRHQINIHLSFPTFSWVSSTLFVFRFLKYTCIHKATQTYHGQFRKIFNEIILYPFFPSLLNLLESFQTLTSNQISQSSNQGIFENLLCIQSVWALG